VTRVAQGVQPPLIAIDGLPCSGKGTLVAKLKERVDLDCVELDDFVLPEEHWRSLNQPAFPFQFVRYDAFLDAVKTLAATGQCSYYPFDWNTLSISKHRPAYKTAGHRRGVITQPGALRSLWRQDFRRERS
jgi:hypothetical protein